MIRTLMTTLLPLALVGVSFASPASASDGPIADTQVIEERPDIATLIYTTALEMRGQDTETTEVTFAPAARAALRADGFDYDGFGRPRFTLMRLAENEANADQTEVGVVMIFTDALLRQTSVSVLLTCTWSAEGDHITVDAATANRVSPPQFTMALTIVPTSRVPKDLLTKYTHAELLPWILANRATEEELANGDADECYLFAMVYDRLTADATLGILIADEPDGLSGQSGNCEDIDYNGWHLAILRGTFDWEGDQMFYAKVVHTPGRDPHSPQVIGILSSQLTPVDEHGDPIRSAWLPGLSERTTRIAACVLAVLGLLIALLGYKLGRMFFALLGFLAGAAAGLVAMEAIRLGQLPMPDAIENFLIQHPVVMPAAILVPALLGLIVFAAVRWLGLLLLGAGVGAAVGIAMTDEMARFTSPVVLVAMCVVAMCVVAIFAPITRRLFTIFPSAVVGASLVAIGVGQWFNVLDVRGWQPAHLYPACCGWTTGQLAHWLEAIHGRPLTILVLAVTVFAVGVGFQLLTTRQRVADDTLLA